MPQGRLTPIEVIDIVVETYVKHPENRSFNETKTECLYNGLNGKHCAFGMFCDNVEDLQESFSAIVLLDRGIAELKKEVAHIKNGRFWGDIQALHDGYLKSSVAIHAMMEISSLTDKQHSYIPERVEKYVAWMKKNYAEYNP